MPSADSPIVNFLRHSRLSHPRVLLVLRLLIGAIFIYASWDKILHPDRFAEIIMGYRVVSPPAADVIAIWLPWTELVTGVVLVVGIWPRAASLLFTGVTVVFIGGLGQALARGIDLQCGCFSTSPDAAIRTPASMWQEGLLLLGCLWLWIGHWPSLDKPGRDAG